MNTSDKDTKGQGWKETLESWEPKVDAGGWEALQQRVPSGRLFRMRQWVEGSAVKAARLLGKATVVKVAAVAVIATAVPGDLAQRASTKEPTTQIASIQPVAMATDSSKNIRYTLAQKESRDSGNALLSNNTVIETPQDIPSDGLAEPKKTEQEPLRTTISKKVSSPEQPKGTIAKRGTTSATSTKTEYSSPKKDNSNDRGSGNKPAAIQNQPRSESEKKVTNINEELLDANNAQTRMTNEQGIANTEVKLDANQEIEQQPEVTIETSKGNVNPTVTSNGAEQSAVISNPSATTLVVDSTAPANITPTTDSLSSKDKIEEPAKETSKGTNLSFYKAISASGGIFSASNASGGFEQANFYFGAYYRNIFGARVSAGVTAFQAKLKATAVSIADTGEIDSTQLIPTNQRYKLQQLTLGLDISQKVWSNELTTIYVLEGIRGGYIIGESPDSKRSSKVTPLASARLSVAIYRRTRYGLLFVEPSFEYQTSRVGILTKGTTALGITVGWCF